MTFYQPRLVPGVRQLDGDPTADPPLLATISAGGVIESVDVIDYNRRD